MKKTEILQFIFRPHDLLCRGRKITICVAFRIFSEFGRISTLLLHLIRESFSHLGPVGSAYDLQTIFREFEPEREICLAEKIQVVSGRSKLISIDRFQRINNPGLNCLNFLHVFVGYQANFP